MWLGSLDFLALFCPALQSALPASERFSLCFLDTKEGLSFYFPGDTFLTVVTNDTITLKESGDPFVMPFFIELNVMSLDNGIFIFSLVSNTDVTEIDRNNVGCIFNLK